MASTTASIDQAFVLRAEAVRRIAALLADKIGPISISALCADGVQREFADIDAFIRYDNVKTRELREVQINAVSMESRQRASVSFSSREYSLVNFPVSSAADDLVVSLRQDILAFVAESRPWYGAITKLTFLPMVLAVLIAGMVGLLVGVATGFIRTSPSNGEDARQVSEIYLGVGVVTAVIWVLAVLRARVFPATAFAIGEGEHRFRTAENIRWCVVIGLAISVGGSLLVTFIRH